MRRRGRRKIGKFEAALILCAMIAAPFLPKQEPAPSSARGSFAAAAPAAPAPTPALVRGTEKELTRRSPSKNRSAGASAAATEKARVARIVDGDTIEVSIGGVTESVRLIGVDTPEKRANMKAQRDAARTQSDIRTIIAAGKAASAYLASLIKPGDAVVLEFDTRPRDRYGRYLAYVYTADGTMLNEALVLGGYAQAYTLPPDIRYAERFRRAEELARKEGRGLWR